MEGNMPIVNCIRPTIPVVIITSMVYNPHCQIYPRTSLQKYLAPILMITLDVPWIFDCSNMTSLGDYWIVIKIFMHQHTGKLRKHSTSRKICLLAITIQLATIMSHNHTITSYL